MPVESEISCISLEPLLLVCTKTNSPLLVSEAFLKKGSKLSIPNHGLIVRASLGNGASFPKYAFAYD